MIYVYNNKKDFFKDNFEILNKNYISNSFILLSIEHMDTFNCDNYAIKIEENGCYAIIVKRYTFNALITGSINLLGKLMKYIYENNYTFNKVLADNDIANKAVEEYCKLTNKKYKINLSMDIMQCRKVNDYNRNKYKLLNLSIEDINEVISLCKAFGLEALNTNEVNIEDIKENINSYYGVRINNKLVSMAKKTRENDTSGAISYVYIVKDYRNLGFSHFIVSKLTEDYINNNKISYLYVDKKNPVSNHLYLSIGYEYLLPKVEIEIK